MSNEELRHEILGLAIIAYGLGSPKVDRNMEYIDKLISQHDKNLLMSIPVEERLQLKHNQGYQLWCRKCYDWKGNAVFREFPPFCPDCGSKVERVERFLDDYDEEITGYNQHVIEVLRWRDEQLNKLGGEK